MEDSTRIVLAAIINNISAQPGGAQFATNLAHDLWQAAEELPGHPATIAEIGVFATLASKIRDASR